MAIPSITRTPIFRIAMDVPDSIIEIDDALEDAPVNGLSYTLALLRLSSSGSVGRIGGLASTLAPLVLSSGHGSNQLRGALAQALASVTLNAAGGLTGRTGVLSQTLAAQILSSAGISPKHGALVQTLAAQILSSAGISPKHGALSQTLAALGVSATGTNQLRGTLAQTLAPLVVSASHGTNGLRGALTSTFGAATLSAAGVSPGAAWVPTNLTALGAWYDPSDFTTMWQDAAKTTPVTAAGQPVGYIADKGPNLFHMSQTTTTLRPTLRQDVNSKWYLEFVSANRTRLDPVAGNLGTFHKGVGLFFIAAAAQAVTNGAGGVIGWLGSPTVEFGHSVEGLRTGWTALGRRLNSDSWQAIAVGTNDYTTQSVIGIYNYSGATASIYKNNVSVASGAFQTAGLSDATGASATFGIGDSAGWNFSFDGKLYQFVMGTALSTAEQTSLDTFLRTKF